MMQSAHQKIDEMHTLQSAHRVVLDLQREVEQSGTSFGNHKCLNSELQSVIITIRASITHRAGTIDSVETTTVRLHESSAQGLHNASATANFKIPTSFERRYTKQRAGGQLEKVEGAHSQC